MILIAPDVKRGFQLNGSLNYFGVRFAPLQVPDKANYYATTATLKSKLSLQLTYRETIYA